MRSLPRASARFRHGMLFACALVCALAFAGPAGAAPSVRIVRDVPVPTTGGARITIDVWKFGSPRGGGARVRRGSAPLRRIALLVHGGGWHSGDKRQWEQSRWAQRLAKNGWLVVNANYRLACQAPRSAGGSRGAQLCGHAMRDSINDVKSALRFTAARAASWGGDPDHIVLFGASAGGHLAMLAASDPKRPRGVRAVVAIGPPTDLSWVGAQPSIALYASARQSLGCSLEECPAAWRDASPVQWIRAGVTPPTWIFNAEADPVTSITPIRDYVARMQQAGIPVTLATLANPAIDCHGPIACANEQLAEGSGDLFEHALTWLGTHA